MEPSVAYHGPCMSQKFLAKTTMTLPKKSQSSKCKHLHVDQLALNCYLATLCKINNVVLIFVKIVFARGV